MRTGRLEAFSDGVIAILITIMVLELKVPLGAPTFGDLKPLVPVFLSYVMSFVYLGIYWNNHHHLFQVVDRVNGRILWANLHLLFWLSLIPFATGWMGENSFAPATIALYGVNLLLAGLAYVVLQIAILQAPEGNPVLAAAIGRDFKGKASLFLYSAGVALSFLSRAAACATYVLVALLWLIPDPRIERAFSTHDRDDRNTTA
jgi:uncharacterized membrane protein